MDISALQIKNAELLCERDFLVVKYGKDRSIYSWKFLEIPRGTGRVTMLKLLRNSYYDGEYYLALKKGLNAACIPSDKPVRESTQDRNLAINIVRNHIKECLENGQVPRIVDGVKLVKIKLTKNRYKDQTIHDWIKQEYPAVSRKQGRIAKKL